MSEITQEDSVRRLAEIRVAYEAADDFTRARMGNVKWMIDCIDSLTAERDQLRLMLDTEYRVAAIESGLLARAEAAEAERDNAREQLRLANIDAVNTATELQAAEADRERLREALEWVLGESDWRLEYYASTPAPIAIDTTDKYHLRVRTSEEMAALATPPSKPKRSGYDLYRETGLGYEDVAPPSEGEQS